MAEFGAAPVLDPVPVTPPPWHDGHEHPESVDDQLDQMPGILHGDDYRPTGSLSD